MSDDLTAEVTPQKDEGGEHVPEQVVESSELEMALKLAEERLDQLKRCQADLENIRKMAEREKKETARYAAEKLIIRLLGFLDSLEQAAKHDEGCKLLLQQLMDILKGEGLEPVPSVGLRFDPYRHEALMQVTSQELEDGFVAQELQRGYTLHSKVLRTAKVAVVTDNKC